MRRKILVGIVSVILLVGLIGCSTDTAWRRTTVATYELLGAGISATKDTAELLRAQNVITDTDILKVKEVYNKARNVYIAAGNTLKLAGKTEDAVARGKLLDEYLVLINDFKNLSIQLYDLIKNWKKVSLNDVEMMIIGGGIWLNSH